MITGKKFLMWKTRGLTWDFEFLSRPEEPLTGWGEFFEHVFKDYEFRRDDMRQRGTVYKSGKMVLKGLFRFLDKNYYYIAAMFRDPTGAVDRAGRPITHFMLLMMKNEQEIGLYGDKWEMELLTQLTGGKWWSATKIFSITREADEDSIQYSDRLLSFNILPEVYILRDDQPAIRWENVKDFIVPRNYPYRKK